MKDNIILDKSFSIIKQIIKLLTSIVKSSKENS